MATAWSISVAKKADQFPVTGAAAITTNKALEIRADLDFFGSNAEVVVELQKIIGYLQSQHLPFAT